MRKNFLIIIFLFAGALNFVKAQGVYFNGLGRVIVTNDQLKGLALNPDTLHSRPDTANAHKGTSGYTLFDLGVNAQPSEALRANVILRIKNDFGGFFGDGSHLIIRQVRLDGILNKVFKYEIGDIDLSMTPYTFYNFATEYHDYEADVFTIRRSIVQYQNYNSGHNWRVQGFHGNTALKISKKYFEKISFDAFGVRTRRSNFLNLPDRLLAGGQVKFKQSKYFNFGVNYIRFWDLPNTAPSPVENYVNNVLTGDYRLQYKSDPATLALFGEFGKSNYSYDTTKVQVQTNDYFYDLGASAKYNPLNLKLKVSYRYVGPYFSSPGAQTRRIYDYGNTALFPTIGNNEMLARQPLLLDRVSDEQLRNLTLQAFLMNYNPAYNNITPYGMATPNRKGMTVALSAGGADKIVTADLIYNKLSEIVGEGVSGTNNLRQFTGLKGGASIAINKLIKFEKAISVTGGFRYENTQRKSAVNPISLKSTLLDAGITVEALKHFDLMAGYKKLIANGNEYMAVRDNYNLIVGYSALSMNMSQSLFSAGIRYRFSRNTFFSGQVVFQQYSDKIQKFNNYEISQVFLSYTMVF